MDTAFNSRQGLEKGGIWMRLGKMCSVLEFFVAFLKKQRHDQYSQVFLIYLFLEDALEIICWVLF